MIEVALKLFVVTLVMAGGLVLAARASRGGRPGSGIRVSGRHGVSKGAVVAVVEVDGRRFLVGAGDQQVALLTELEPAAQDDQLPELASTTEAEGPRTPVARVATALGSLHRQSRRPHWTGSSTTSGPRIGPLDRLRAMTVRSHLRDGAPAGSELPIHVQPPAS